MATTLTSFRFPFTLEADGIHPEIRQAIRYTFNGLVDMNAAIAKLTPMVNGASAAAAAAAATPPTIVVSGSSQLTAGAVNAQSGTSYKLQQSDFGALVACSNAGTFTLTLNSSLMTPMFSFVGNFGTAGITLTASTGSISGSTSIPPSEMAIVFFDGTNWKVISQLNPLFGTSASLGGSAMLAGDTIKITVSVLGATTSMVATTSPQTYPGDGFVWDSYVSAADTVTVRLTAVKAGTPTASLYNVRVSQ